MTTQMVSIHYPAGPVETIAARATDKPDEFELRAHAFLTQLGPGDVVRVDSENRVTEVVSLDPQYIWQVDLHLPADYLAGPLPENHPGLMTAERLAVEWARDASVTQMTTFIMLVSSGSEKWFKDKVATSKYVEHIEVIRTPKERHVSLQEMRHG